MNTVTLHAGTLTVEPRGLDKLWSFTRRLTIPLGHVRGATLDPGAGHEPKGLRGPGLRLGGKASGTFRREGERSFWNVDREGSTVVIELDGEYYSRLFLTVNDPRPLVDAINQAIQS